MKPLSILQDLFRSMLHLPNFKQTMWYVEKYEKREAGLEVLKAGDCS